MKAHAIHGAEWWREAGDSIAREDERNGFARSAAEDVDIEAAMAQDLDAEGDGRGEALAALLRGYRG